MRAVDVKPGMRTDRFEVLSNKPGGDGRVMNLRFFNDGTSEYWTFENDTDFPIVEG